MCEGRSIPSHWLKRENYRESESVELKEIETGVVERRMQLRSKVFYVWILGFLWFFTKTKICSQGFQKWIVWYLVKKFNHHLKRLSQKTYWLFLKKICKNILFVLTFWANSRFGPYIFKTPMLVLISIITILVPTVILVTEIAYMVDGMHYWHTKY